jgi:hypothetical protein
VHRPAGGRPDDKEAFLVRLETSVAPDSLGEWPELGGIADVAVVVYTIDEQHRRIADWLDRLDKLRQTTEMNDDDDQPGDRDRMELLLARTRDVLGGDVRRLEQLATALRDATPQTETLRWRLDDPAAAGRLADDE